MRIGQVAHFSEGRGPYLWGLRPLMRRLPVYWVQQYGQPPRFGFTGNLTGTQRASEGSAEHETPG